MLHSLCVGLASPESSKQASRQAGRQAGKQASKQGINHPSKQHSNQATKQPSNQATKEPSNQATKQPSNQATNQPTNKINKNNNSFASSNPHPPHSRAYDREHGCVNSSMVFEWLGALSTCLCVKLHLSASRSRELQHRCR